MNPHSHPYRGHRRCERSLAKAWSRRSRGDGGLLRGCRLLAGGVGLGARLGLEAVVAVLAICLAPVGDNGVYRSRPTIYSAPGPGTKRTTNEISRSDTPTKETTTCGTHKKQCSHEPQQLNKQASFRNAACCIADLKPPPSPRTFESRVSCKVSPCPHKNKKDVRYLQLP